MMTYSEIKETIIDLKKEGMTYKAIATRADISYGVLRNFMCGYRDNMNQENTEKLTKYLEQELRMKEIIAGMRLEED
jgi:transposase